jgi:glycerol-3-phosphate dehydrogenase
MNAYSSPKPTQRAELLAQLTAQESRNASYDIVIVGGGATGLGVALDAALRGFSVLLIEAHDFAKGTSSRATKLVHGGVRYLAQGNITLVKEALRERMTLLNNAPHLSQRLPFVMPSYNALDIPFYGIGLTLYDALAGKAGLGKTECLNAENTLKHLPTLKHNTHQRCLKGGVKYWDGQFDDARLALALARSAARAGALLLNYCKATRLIHTQGKISGLECQDQETHQTYTVQAKCIINATGVWVDALRQQDQQSLNPDQIPAPIVTASQGVHIVVGRRFLPSNHALLIPKTIDGRVLFAVPWLGATILGTTDAPRNDLPIEPMAFKEEVDFILRECANYLSCPPTVADIQSIWAGLRPLVKPAHTKNSSTQAISRSHTVLLSDSGLVTVTGGKWTTYRAIAEDVLEQCFDRGLLSKRAGGITHNHRLVGGEQGDKNTHSLSDAQGLHSYGSEQHIVANMIGGRQLVDDAYPSLTEGMVRFAAQFEYARTVEDILARRSRLLFLDAALAKKIAPKVAVILHAETGADTQLASFEALANQYLTVPSI